MKMTIGLENQLRRQSVWLKDSLLWILETKVLNSTGIGNRPEALDVGCGPGLTMEILDKSMSVKGLDKDPEMVETAKAKGLEATLGNAEELPYDDRSFDVVYCSFLLMWVRDPQKVLEEMKRVSRDWVIAFAEPDYGARLDYPPQLSRLTQLVSEGIMSEGGDPFIGRKLRQLFCHMGLRAEIGVHMGIWDVDRLRKESADEWRWLEMTAPKNKMTELIELRPVWQHALEQGALFQFNPIFYALARKNE